MKPVRIHLQRKKGWRMPAGAMACTRPGPWGNPFVPRQTWPEEGGPPRWQLDTTRNDADVREIARTFNAYPMAGHKDALALAVEAHRKWMEGNHLIRQSARMKLAGKSLACFCKPGHPCHVDNLLFYANQ